MASDRKQRRSIALKNYPVSKFDDDLDDKEQLVEDGLEIEKTEGGDEVWKILQDGIEPYTLQEEKIVIRKIDRRLLWIMLV